MPPGDGDDSGAADLGEEFLEQGEGVCEVGGASFAFDPGGSACGHEDAADVGEGAVVVVADEAEVSAEGCELREEAGVVLGRGMVFVFFVGAVVVIGG